MARTHVRNATLAAALLVAAATILQGCWLFTPRERNLSWEGDKIYVPAPSETLVIDGFGIDDSVDVLPSGSLTPPLRFERAIQNTGNAAIPAGYVVRERIVHWIFQAIGGTAGYVPGPDATHLVFECEQPGPPLAPGASAVLSFEVPSAFCQQMNPPAALTALPCGLYQETLTIDTGDDVNETDETDNESRHFFFVPSDVRISIVANPNPTGNPDIMVGPAAQVIVRDWAAAGSSAWGFIISATPATARFRVFGRSPVTGPLAGDSGMLVPATPLGPVGSPLLMTYNITPNPAFAGPCNNIAAMVYEEDISTKITVISEDGCVIRQRFVPTVVWHECF